MNKKVTVENLEQLIEEHKKEKIPYKTYEFDSDSYTLLLCDINQLKSQLEEKDKVIKEKNKCLLEIAKEEINFINYLKSKGMNFDNENWVNELEEILKRGKDEIKRITN